MLIEESFREAQEKAFRAFDCQAVRDGHASKDDYERYDRALITAYLSHDAVLAAAGDAVASTTAASDVLQAIGATKK